MGKYIGAPYNFVPFQKEIIEVGEKQMKVRGKISDDLLTGEIDYTITAKTALFIDGGDQQFTRDEWGRQIIPGSSVRGLIRTNAQILGLADFEDDIQDCNLMYRDVTSGLNSEKYKNVLGAKQVLVQGKRISVIKNVKAGYIQKQNDGYVIYKTEVDHIDKANFGDMNYYVINERYAGENLKNFPFLKNHMEYAQHDLNRPFHKNGRNWKGESNAYYKPGYYDVSYKTKGKNVTALDEPEKCANEGVLVCTGHINYKKALYVVPRIDKESEPISIPPEDIRSFIVDFNKRKNSLKGQGKHSNVSYFDLPKEGELKPVFYIILGRRLYFGFTPRLRVFYDYSVKDGYHNAYANTKRPAFDYVKSIFGMSDDIASYRSKVSFSDALPVGDIQQLPEAKCILAEPKASSYWDYLVQSGMGQTYDSEGFELRGIKQYWLHKNTLPGSNFKNSNVASSLHPLAAGTRFKGKVRFQNLTPDELGLLLWSIRLEDGAKMNLGKAKAFGYGVIEVSDVLLKLMDYAKAYDLSGTLDFSPWADQNKEQNTAEYYIGQYKAEAGKRLGGRNIEQLESIKAFFLMKKEMPEEENIRYMNIDHKEYQDRHTPLPSIQDTIKGIQTAPTAKRQDKPEQINGSKKEERKAPKKVELENGQQYTATVIGHEGKNIKLKIDGNYYKVSINDMHGIEDLNKKNMKEKLPKDSSIKLLYTLSGENKKYDIIHE